MHAWLQVGDQALMGCDAPGANAAPMAGFTVALHVGEPAEAERIFRALEEGGEVSMPFGERFWSPACASRTDRFGTPWLIVAGPG